MTLPQHAPDVRARQAASNVAGNLIRRANERARTTALMGHREQVEGNVVVPTIRVPNGHLRLRLHGPCPYCASSVFDLDLPPTDVDRAHPRYRGTVLCMLCTRAVAYLEIGSDDTRTAAERFAALPQRKRGPRRSDGTATERLIRLLASGGPMHPDYLTRRLDVSVDALRNAVHSARRAGHQIETTPQGYRLDGAP